jgi:hypothetical protein
MREKVMLILGCLALASSGCGNRTTLVHTDQAQNQHRVIVHLATRNEITSVMSGRNGPVYTIKTKDGSLLEERISEQELWTKFPAIYRLLKTSYASKSSSNATWAGGNL